MNFRMMENSHRIQLGRALQKHAKKSHQKIWQDLSEAILGSRKNRPSVNVAEISRNSKEGASVVIAAVALACFLEPEYSFVFLPGI